MPSDFRSASIVDGVRFTAQIAVPNVVQGLFAKRALPVRAGAALHGDHLGYLLMQGLVRRLGPDPFWVRVVKDQTLIVHHPDDLRLVLGGSPEPFAADPESKRKGMAAFQPNALTISRGDLWRNRRRFAEAVLDTGVAAAPPGPDLLGVAGDEAGRLAQRGTVRWGDVNRAFQRLTRRVVFGEAAADDEAASPPSSASSCPPATGCRASRPAGTTAFVQRVQDYVDAAQPGSLCSLVADAPADAETDPAGQVIHWLFAMGDTLAANVFRALAVLATHDEQRAQALAQLDGRRPPQPQWVANADYLAGCLQEAMRLWPTTQLFGRVATADVRWPDGKVLPDGEQRPDLQPVQPPQPRPHRVRGPVRARGVGQRVGGRRLVVQLLQPRAAGLPAGPGWRCSSARPCWPSCSPRPRPPLGGGGLRPGPRAAARPRHLRDLGPAERGIAVRGAVRRLDCTFDSTRCRFTHCPVRPGANQKGTSTCAKASTPTYVVTQVTCSCGNTFTTRSTAKGGVLHADVCSACHPFYTGKQKIMDVGGRVDKFEKRYGKRVRATPSYLDGARARPTGRAPRGAVVASPPVAVTSRAEGRLRR